MVWEKHQMPVISQWQHHIFRQAAHRALISVQFSIHTSDWLEAFSSLRIFADHTKSWFAFYSESILKDVEGTFRNKGAIFDLVYVCCIYGQTTFASITSKKVTDRSERPVHRLLHTIHQKQSATSTVLDSFVCRKREHDTSVWLCVVSLQLTDVKTWECRTMHPWLHQDI